MNINKIPLFFISLYQQFLSPLLAPSCRFYPSCSCYAKECFQSFSFFKALWYLGIRLLKCHPFHSGGIDLVPHHHNNIVKSDQN